MRFDAPRAPYSGRCDIPENHVRSPLKAEGVGKKVISPICSENPLKNGGFLRFLGLAFPYNLLQPLRGQNYNPFEN